MKRQKNKQKIITICGPTASGKTTLAVRIAAEFGCEIISADSRQVYRGMDIGTGKDLQEYENNGRPVPFHCIDIADPAVPYSLYDYLGDFERALNEISRHEKIPLLVGGTGLYIEAALKQYRIPNVPENTDLRKELIKKDQQTLQVELLDLSRDIYSNTDLSSKKRIIRSIEVALFEKNNRVEYSCMQPVNMDPLIIAVQWPREELIQRIDDRLRLRLEQGMVEEVRELIKNGLSFERLDWFGMEYRYIAEYLKGEMSYGEMFESLKVQIHRLAKRQMTWFRGMQKRGFNILRVNRADYEKIYSPVEEFLA